MPPEADETATILDLTLPFSPEKDGKPLVTTERRTACIAGADWAPRVFHLTHDSMAGTYLDLPGHFEETDDGSDGENYPLTQLWRVPATVVRLDRESGSGGISRTELANACPIPPYGGALILNALGERRFDEISWRSVFLNTDAVHWMIQTGIHLLVSDVYESLALSEGVFPSLFKAGISTVCAPIHLDRITQQSVRLTVLPLRIPGVTQLPCRVLVEQSGNGQSLSDSTASPLSPAML